MRNSCLRIHPDNPRFVTDGTGQAIFLTGSHTWAAIQDRRLPETPPFDYEAWLELMRRNRHNLMRIWLWEHASWMQFTDRMVEYSPTLYERTGPGEALDGKLKFDLTKLNEAYFTRLRERVLKAQAYGIHVVVMLSQGFSLDKTGGKPDRHKAYNGHPYNKHNNLNGIDGDPDGSGTGKQVHTLDNPEVLALQEVFVRKMIDTLNDIDGLLWEIGNENHQNSYAWQCHMVEFIRAYERTKPKQHLIGMSGAPITNADLRASTADWIAPMKGDGYNDDIPEADGSKVILIDTDHVDWDKARQDPYLPWKALFRGHHFIYMDAYMDCRIGSPSQPDPEEDEIRKQMGLALTFSRQIDLAHMVPMRGLSSTAYCLALPGVTYAAFVPQGEKLRLDLREGTGGRFRCVWFDCADGSTTMEETPIVGGGDVELTSPCAGPSAVRLSLVREGR